MRTYLYTLLAGSLLCSSLATAAVDRQNIIGRLPTKLSQQEVAREGIDKKVYPIFMKFLEDVDISNHMRPRDPRNRELVKTPYVFQPDQKMWSNFFKAAAADKLTVLRAWALLSREVKKAGVVIMGPGEDFERAVKENNVDLGLALPAKNIGTAIWTPDPDVKDPEFLLHMKVFYTKPFVHKFPDHILPANLKIGFNRSKVKYWMNNQMYEHITVDTDVYYGPSNGVGFRNVSGIGGQKRGFMGFIQKVFFFLPDAVDSMFIDESSDTLVTEALVNTKVASFESDPKYGIKILTE